MPGAAPRAFAATHLDGRAIAHRQVHHPADFAAVHLAKRSAKDGEILSVNVHCPAVDLTIARHDPFAEVLLTGEAKLVALVCDERLQFVEGTCIQQ